MGKSTTDQTGFELVVVAVVLVAVVLLGTSGWLVYHDHYKTKSAVADGTATTSKPDTDQSSPSSSKPIQNATRYLAITEWGVSLPLPASIQKAYYVVPIGAEDNGIDGKPNVIFVSDHSIDSACGGVLTASGEGASDGLGEILRVQPDALDPMSPGGNEDETYVQTHPGGTIVDGWYYAFNGPNDACTKTSDTASITAGFKSAAASAVRSSDAAQ